MNHRTWFTTCCISALALAGSAAGAVNLIVGLATGGPGSALVKRFDVPAGTVITGVEFKNNDDSVVFPKVALLAGDVDRLADATRLVEVENVRAVGRHRVRPSFESVTVRELGAVLVVVTWPVNSTLNGVGSGAGIGATAQAAPSGCFIAPGLRERLQPLFANLAIELMSDAGRANGTEKSGTSESPVRLVVVSDHRAGVTRFEFHVKQYSRTRLEIYNVAGRLAYLLVDEGLPGGDHLREWTGRDAAGNTLGSGVYLAKLIVDKVETTRKFVRLR